MRTYLRFKRKTSNPGTAKQFGSGDIYHGARLTGFFFIAEWQWKEDAGDNVKGLTPFDNKICLEAYGLKSAVVHVFNENGAALSFYWQPDDGYYHPQSGQSGFDIHKLVAQFIPTGDVVNDIT